MTHITYKTKHNKKDLKTEVLNRISKEKIKPFSKAFWLCSECSVWVLWGVSVIVGALSVAVIIFASMHAGFALYEAIHDSSVVFIIGVLPHLWFVVFILMSILAYYNLRHTKSGYRYSFMRILGSSLVFSLVGGFLLHTAGVGYMLDSFIGKYAQMYNSQESIEHKIWQSPDEGRMIGHIVGEISENTTQFEDINGSVWQLNTIDLQELDLEILETGHKVRLLGVRATASEYSMHVCGVFPWMFNKDIKFSDMKEDRNAFVKRMSAHKNRIRERFSALRNNTFGEEKIGLCASMPTIRRIEQSTQ